MKLSTRDKIIEAYIGLYYEIGPDKVSYQKLATKADCTIGSVQYYFDLQSKELFEASLVYFLEKTYKIIDDRLMEERDKPKFDPIACYIQIMFEWTRSQPTWFSYNVYFYYLTTTKVKISISNEAAIRRARLRIKGLLNEGLGLSLYQEKLNVELISKVIHTLLFGAIIMAGTLRSEDFHSEQLSLTLEAVSKLIKIPAPG